MIKALLKRIETRAPRILNVLERFFPVSNTRSNVHYHRESKDGSLTLRIESQPIGFFGFRHAKKHIIHQDAITDGLLDLFIVDQRELASVITWSIMVTSVGTEEPREWREFCAKLVENSRSELGITTPVGMLG